MISKEEQTRVTVAEQAVDWLLERDEGPLNARESAALMAWYKASPINVEEFLGVAAIARDLRDATPDSEHSVEALVARAHADDEPTVQSLWPSAVAAVSDLGARRWQTSALTIGALALVSLGLFWLWNLRPLPQQLSPTGPVALHFVTRHGEQQTRRLADGSVLHLNTDTAVTVRYGQTERWIMLASGQASFQVVHEPRRPFRVLAGAAEIIDQGTQFDVRMRSDSTVITVVEGRVAVGPSDLSKRRSMSPDQRPAPPPVVLGPNQQISVSSDEWPSAPTVVDAKRATAWLHRQIAFAHEPLAQVAAEFNRYGPKPVEIMTPELRELEITGTFSIDNTEEFIAFLRTLDGVRVDVTATQIRVWKKK